MFTAIRSWFKYGNETDEVEVTLKEYPTLEKAVAYCRRYAKGIRYASSEVEDEKGNIVFEHVAGE